MKMLDIIGVEQSEWWDMDISAKELFEANETALLDVNYRRHYSDDGYGKYALYLSHPQHNREDVKAIVLIADDGFVCGGTTSGRECCKLIPIDEATLLMYRWRDLQVARNMLEQSLMCADIEKNCINMIMDYGYALENSGK